MLVRAAADLHGRLPVIEQCDILILAGDLVPHAIQEDISRSLAWVNGLFAQWLSAAPAQVVLATPGNHDFWALERSDTAQLDIPWHLLTDEAATVVSAGGEIRAYGVPWSPISGGWAFEAQAPALRLVASVVPEDTELLILHAPPYGCGDEIRIEQSSGRPATAHIGVRAWLPAIARSQPALCVFGHAHENGGWQKRVGNTLLANVSIADGQPLAAFELTRDPTTRRLRAESVLLGGG